MVTAQGEAKHVYIYMYTYTYIVHIHIHTSKYDTMVTAQGEALPPDTACRLARRFPGM